MLYAQNRYFVPKIGRFNAQDPIRDGLNWYNYCNANPVKYIDPTGLFDMTGDRDEDRQNIRDATQHIDRGNGTYGATVAQTIDDGLNTVVWGGLNAVDWTLNWIFNSPRVTWNELNRVGNAFNNSLSLTLESGVGAGGGLHVGPGRISAEYTAITGGQTFSLNPSLRSDFSFRGEQLQLSLTGLGDIGLIELWQYTPDGWVLTSTGIYLPYGMKASETTFSFGKSLYMGPGGAFTITFHISEFMRQMRGESLVPTEVMVTLVTCIETGNLQVRVECLE